MTRLLYGSCTTFKPLSRKLYLVNRCKTGLQDEEHFLMNCIAYRDPRRELFNTLKKETNLFLDSMTPSSAFATLISMKQGEKTREIVAKYICDRFRERDRRVKYNLV